MIKAYMGDNGVVAGSTGSVPGFHDIMLKIDGKLENTVYLYQDYPELFEEYVEKAHHAYLARIEQMLDMGFDYIEMSNCRSRPWVTACCPRSNSCTATPCV